MSAHAPLPPSSAHRWVKCALSASLEAAHPETEESPSSLEGTAAHWVNEQLLRGTPAVLDQQAPNGVAVTQQMLEGAEMVQSDIVAALGHDFRSLLFIEQRVNIPRVHPTDNWGTPDYRAWIRMENGRLLLRVWDYKFGHGIVEVFENWQLLDYTAGLLDEAGVPDTEIVVEMIVIQPRAYHRDGPVRRWRVEASELRAYFNILQNAAARATWPNPLAAPDPDACEHCRGRAHCEALQREAYSAADRGGLFGTIDLSPRALGLELRELTRAKALLDARVSGLEEEAVAQIKRGQVVPGWVMESTPGRLAWDKPDAEILALGQLFGLTLTKAPELITPTQAKAAAKAAKLPESLFDAYAKRPAGAAKLKYDDGTMARLTFSSSGT